MAPQLSQEREAELRENEFRAQATTEATPSQKS